MFRIRQPDPGQMEHPDLNGPLILLIYHQPSDFSRKSLKQTYLLMDRVDLMDQMDNKLCSNKVFFSHCACRNNFDGVS
jgi:hypothetical protein